MAVSWYKVTKDVLQLADELIEEYHPELMDCNIGFLFRSEAPTSAGKATLGKAKKVNAETNALLPEEERLDFAIWLARDYWMDVLDEHQRRALIDHELTHCECKDDGSLAMRKHDIDEFNSILRRYGFWWPGSNSTAHAIQERLPLERTGKTVAMEVSEEDRAKLHKVGADFAAKLRSGGIDPGRVTMRVVRGDDDDETAAFADEIRGELEKAGVPVVDRGE